jgi:hypothetical protein
MTHVDRRIWLGCSLFLAQIVGCGSNSIVSVSATSLNKTDAGLVETGSVAVMTTNRAGAVVSVGSDDNRITTTIAEIAHDQVVLDIAQRGFDTQQVSMAPGESKDIFFGDGTTGVRLRFADAK